MSRHPNEIHLVLSICRTKKLGNGKQIASQPLLTRLCPMSYLIIGVFIACFQKIMSNQLKIDFTIMHPLTCTLLYWQAFNIYSTMSLFCYIYYVVTCAFIKRSLSHQLKIDFTITHPLACTLLYWQSFNFGTQQCHFFVVSMVSAIQISFNEWCPRSYNPQLNTFFMSKLSSNQH